MKVRKGVWGILPTPRVGPSWGERGEQISKFTITFTFTFENFFFEMILSLSNFTSKLKVLMINMNKYKGTNLEYRCSTLVCGWYNLQILYLFIVALCFVNDKHNICFPI